jgi:hypothetical protein
VPAGCNFSSSTFASPYFSIKFRPQFVKTNLSICHHHIPPRNLLAISEFFQTNFSKLSTSIRSSQMMGKMFQTFVFLMPSTCVNFKNPTNKIQDFISTISMKRVLAFSSFLKESISSFVTGIQI